MKQALKNIDKLGKATGLYSQGIRAGNCIYTTQIGNICGGPLAGDSMYEQAVQTLRNAEALLAAEGATLENIVKCTIYIVDMHDYAELNRAYEELMPQPYPARACVQVAQLSPGSRVEMEFIAYVEDQKSSRTDTQ